MSMLTPEQVEKDFDDFAALGAILTGSDWIMKVVGSDIGVLVKTHPVPIDSPKGEIELPLRHGLIVYQAQNKKLSDQGGITFQETENLHLRRFAKEVNGKKGGFEAEIILGTEENPKYKIPLKRCFVVFEVGEGDVEASTAGQTYSGTLFFTKLPTKS